MVRAQDFFVLKIIYNVAVIVNFLELNPHEVSTLFHENVLFNESLLTKDAAIEKLFQETGNPNLDGLREKCQELIC